MSISIRRLVTLTALAACAMARADATQAKEPLDRAWLLRYLTQPLPDTPHNRVYLKKVDEAKLSGLLDPDWLDKGTDSGKGRAQATWLGQMAFAYHTKGTRWHRHRPLLEEIRLGLRGFARHQTAEGRFV